VLQISSFVFASSFLFLFLLQMQSRVGQLEDFVLEAAADLGLDTPDDLMTRVDDCTLPVANATARRVEARLRRSPAVQALATGVTAAATQLQHLYDHVMDTHGKLLASLDLAVDAIIGACDELVARLGASPVADYGVVPAFFLAFLFLTFFFVFFVVDRNCCVIRPFVCSKLHQCAAMRQRVRGAGLGGGVSSTIRAGCGGRGAKSATL
jgi:hypothetical protein